MISLDALPVDCRDRFADAAALAALDEAVGAALAERADLGVSRDELAAAIAARLPEGDTRAEIARVRAVDLLLAQAAARGTPEALRLVEAETFGEIAFALSKVRSPMTADEVAQALRAKLFVATGEQPAGIARYSGAGSLKAYVRVAVMRLVLNAATRQPRERALSDEMMEAIPEGTLDPELEHARRLYKAELEEAFGVAAAELDDRERALLRHTLAGLTVDQVGAIYDVHRATAARWIAAARQRLERRVREVLRAKLGAGDESLDSVLRCAREHVELSVGRHFADEIE